jgi:Secretion system C-terminal sorting domain/FG-GAP-like repeat
MRKVLALCLPLILLVSTAMAQDWGYIPISNNVNTALDVQIGDLNGDTFPDLVTSSFDDGTLSWWENDGDAQYSRHDIITLMFGIARLDLADVDQDGDLDILYAVEGTLPVDNRAGWAENVNGNGGIWMDHVISDHTQGNLGTPWDIVAWDFDADGDLDCAVSGSQTGWFRNPGDGVSYWVRTDVDFNDHTHSGIAVGDFNGDFRVDTVSGRGNGIAWWNDLSIGHVGTNWQHFAIGTNYENIKGVDCGDFDQDGDLDIVTCGDVGTGSTVTIFDNFSGTGSSWDRMDISWGFFGVLDVNVIDMDGDGDLDIYGAAFGDDEIAWWENHGNHNYEKHVISILFNGAAAVAAGNIDMDGDIELVGTAYNGDRLGFWDMHSSMYSANLMLTPEADPLIVPQGGFFSYDVDFSATTTNNLLAEYWIYVILQNGREHNLRKEQFTYVQGAVFDINNIMQSTNGAPLGMYEFRLAIDIANEYTFDSFYFEVISAPTTMDGMMGQWGMDNFNWVAKVPAEVASDGELPSEFMLDAAYPNPFNPSTTISVALPETSNLSVRAFNVNGQQVAELANGQFNAGQHNLSFDASNLASGLYFIQAHVPGQLNATQKVMLVR